VLKREKISTGNFIVQPIVIHVLTELSGLRSIRVVVNLVSFLL
jgi:hypothetical protein